MCGNGGGRARKMGVAEGVCIVDRSSGCY